MLRADVHNYGWILDDTDLIVKTIHAYEKRGAVDGQCL